MASEIHADVNHEFAQGAGFYANIGLARMDMIRETQGKGGVLEATGAESVGEIQMTAPALCPICISRQPNGGTATTMWTAFKLRHGISAETAQPRQDLWLSTEGAARRAGRATSDGRAFQPSLRSDASLYFMISSSRTFNRSVFARGSRNAQSESSELIRSASLLTFSVGSKSFATSASN